jgi:hypothetical protein
MTQASFEAAFIEPEEVTPKRLDANFYRATYRQAAQRAARLPSAPLSSLVKSGTVITYGVIKSVQIESGVPMLRIQNLQSGFADADGAVRISAEQHQGFSRSALSGGELLIAIGGYVGVAAKYPNNGPAANINQHVAKADIDFRRANEYYALAYLWSQTGTLLLQRTVTGTVQAGISLGDLRAFPLPLPGRRIQDYVGAKVELAERCRARAGELRAEATTRFDALLRTPEFSPGAGLTNVIDARALTERLTGEFYLPRYFALEAHLGGVGVPVKPLRSLLRSDIIRSSTPERDEAAPVPCILTSDIEPNEIRWRKPSLRITQSVHDRHGGQLASRDVVYTSVGPPVGEAAVVLPQFLPMAVGGDVSILRHGDDLHPGFLALYLNSVFGQMQNDRYSRGIRQRRVYPEDIGAFLIPVFGAKDQAYVGERIVRHQVLNELAVDLVNEAKADVEALIEGTLDVQAILAGTLKPPTSEDIPELAENG